MTLRTAIVGCGFQGRAHAEAFATIPEVEVVAACDVDPARLESMRADFGVQGLYTDYRELVREARPDLVTVCVLATLHRDVALVALEGGAHVMCEKPFAMDLDEAVDLAGAARRADRQLAVGFNMRWFEAARSIKGFVDGGLLGEPICARGWMLADDVPWWGRHYVRGASGGGALASTAVHMLDLVLWLAGSPTPVTVSASMATIFPRKRRAGAPSDAEAALYDADDLVFGHVRCDNGFWFTIEGAWVWEGSGWNYSCDLVGDRAQARLDPLSLLGERDGAITQDLLPPGAPDGTDFPASVRAELADVVAALESGRPVPVRVEEALAVQAVSDGFYRSAELGHEVEIAVPEVPE